MLIVISHQGDAKQNHSEISRHSHEDHSYSSVSARMLENRNAQTVLVGMFKGVATSEKGLAVSQNVKQSYHMLKVRQQAQDGVAYAKPHIPKPRFNLITVLALPEMSSYTDPLRIA